MPSKREVHTYYLVVAQNRAGDMVRQAYIKDYLIPTGSIHPDKTNDGAVKMIMAGEAWAGEVAFPRRKDIFKVFATEYIDITYNVPVIAMLPSAILVFDNRIMRNIQNMPYRGR